MATTKQPRLIKQNHSFEIMVRSVVGGGALVDDDDDDVIQTCQGKDPVAANCMRTALMDASL